MFQPQHETLASWLLNKNIASEKLKLWCLGSKIQGLGLGFGVLLVELLAHLWVFTIVQDTDEKSEQSKTWLQIHDFMEQMRKCQHVFTPMASTDGASFSDALTAWFNV